MERLKELLAKECSYRLPDAVMDDFLSMGERLRLKAKDVIIRRGETNRDIYVLEEGILRNCYFDGGRDVTVGFGLPGTLVIDMHSYYMRRPAIYQVDACCESVVLWFRKKDFDGLLARSHEFALWMLSMEMTQLYCYEMKHEVINGDAKERFEKLIRNRPEIIKKVPLRMIASYLGITQAYLSRLRKTVR